MKKPVALCIVLTCVLILAGCSASWISNEMGTSASVEITSYENGEACEVITITEKGKVEDICQTVSSLSAKKMNYHKPAEKQYSIRFLNSAGDEIQSIDFLFGNTVVTNGQIYGITDDIQILEYIEDIISSSSRE